MASLVSHPAYSSHVLNGQDSGGSKCYTVVKDPIRRSVHREAE